VTEASPRSWQRYVAIGDSFTEGMSPPPPDRPGTYVGWADRLASHLSARAVDEGSEFGYANLAIRGRLLADIAGPQVDAALALEPDLVSIVGGGNDILRPRADIDALAGELERAVARVRATGADVLMATPADPSEAPLLRHTRGRVAIYTAHIWSIARQHGAHVLDQWSMTPLKDWRMWADDRIHMTPEGHRRVALRALSALGHEVDDNDWARPLPAPVRLGRLALARDNARWAREYVRPWVGRRLRGRSSGDGISAKRPTIAPLEQPPRPDAAR
jgi:lysophospholipase L1-like esterase